jgi:hypothetical protein
MAETAPEVLLLAFDQCQRPEHQVQVHKRCCVPLLEIVSLHAVLPELRIEQLQLLLVAQV